MIRIGKVYKNSKDNFEYLCSRVQDEYRLLDKVIWFRTTLEYSEYLYDHCADPFIISLLIPAVKYHQDIIVDDNMSQTLYYHTTNVLLHLFSSIYDESYDGTNLNSHVVVNGDLIDVSTHASGVACGCSLGIDSLCCILGHLSEYCPSSYRLTHLTFFDVGAITQDISDAKNKFKSALKIIERFGKEIGLPIVTMESNLHFLYDPEILCYEQTHTLRNAAAVLAMRLLFKKYYYASSYPIEDVRLSEESISYLDNLILPLLATDIEFIEADADKTRVAKTKGIADNKLAQRYLHVCWHDMAPYYDPVWKMDLSNVRTLNCTRCDKCLRTISTLDVLGKAENFREVFDLDYWYSVRDEYFFKVLTHPENTFYVEIADLIYRTNYPLSKSLQKKLKLHEYHILQILEYVNKIFLRVKRKIKKLLRLM